MTNREKYANEMRIALSQNTFGEFYDKYIHPTYRSGEFHFLRDYERAIYTSLWLDEEYTEPEVDWSKVAVDTPILVRDRDGDAWRPRYFAKYENDQICTWGNGATSWSGDGSMSCWNEAKLAEAEE